MSAGRLGRWAVPLAAIAAPAIVIAVAVTAGSAPYSLLGLGDPGTLVRGVAPLLRLIAEACAVICAGALTFAAFFAPDESGRLAPHGYAAVVSAGRWAVGWAVAAAALVPVEAADLSGVPLSGPPLRAPVNDQLALWATLEQPMAWLVTAVLAAAVAVACRWVLRWQPTVVVWAVSIVAVLPQAVTGHSASDAGHDLAEAALVIHVPVAVAWIGLLIALLRPAWRRGVPAEVLRRRYQRFALGSWLALAGSGLVVAAVLIPAGRHRTGDYLWWFLVKVVLVAGLGVIGIWLRRNPNHRSGTARMLGLCAGELVVLSATAGISVGLTHLTPPADTGPVATPDQAFLGFDLPHPPGVMRLLLDWRFDPLLGTLALLLAAVYLAACYRIRRRGWPRGRTVAWLTGCAVLLIASCSGIARYAGAMFSYHIVAHMLIGMLAPVLLALGAPLTLLRSTGAREGSGPTEWITTLAESRLIRALTHPLSATAIFAGAPFVLYCTGLFDAAVRFHWAHLLIDVVFLSIGYLFAWMVVGPDPGPRPMPMIARLGMLLAAMPADIIFAATLFDTHTLIGDGRASANMYSALRLPWVRDLFADQHAAALAALLIGEAALLIATAALVFRWRSDTEQAGDDATDPYKALANALRSHHEHSPQLSSSTR
ncbi:cytochrome c oxidase assembly factor CtaG/putative copper export protein [Nocardia sp. GAS34]|uniref:cytochrome c oxidase assembly protein n=1 Tax=unclassified Nocardia TaxID=2637762 RepID=UPI003D247F27